MSCARSFALATITERYSMHGDRLQISFRIGLGLGLGLGLELDIVLGLGLRLKCFLVRPQTNCHSSMCHANISSLER